MDPVTTAAGIGALEKVNAQNGFNAVLVLVLIAAIGLIVRGFLSFLKDERTESRTERKEDREAHLTKLGEFSGAIRELGEGLAKVAEGVTDIKREVERPTVRRGG